MEQGRIRYLTQEEKYNTRTMYEEIFTEDSGKFVDYYYDWKLRDNEILVMEDGDPAESGRYQVMLHLNPYDLWINGKVRKIPYIVAVATRPDCRRQGKMEQVMKYALGKLEQDQVPFTFLMPADPAYYRGQGFVYFPQEKPLAADVLRAASIEAAFREGKLKDSMGDAGRQKKMLACRRAEVWDFPILTELSNELLQERYQIFVRRTESYYSRLMAETKAEHGGILLLEAAGSLRGLAAYGVEEGSAELKELLIPENLQEQAEEVVRGALADYKVTRGDFPMMVRIASLKAVVPLLRSAKACCYQVKVTDSMIPANNGCYRIELSKEQGRIREISEQEVRQELDMAELTELLFADTSVHLQEWV